ncbi:CpsD/CapB family tyrosine-protein kinase [Paenibacillus protaetiae]|uniref:non-specific protein-tyrosine kinase n=1 Tax=Paenibacillus protaetiae TaxID=2509456 RepID=A0A4P6F0L2_9BACL|nr:CpsD/CapB family tyrosine-protein kinase [Paenibacillus protaetiae]QAY68143.1 polysaccharide biosynthesis tyrosine autokinase [Paenibacillus protaetiae]
MPRQMSDRKLITYYNPESPIAETYRTLRTNIQFSSIDNPLRTLIVTSPNSGDGKTTTVANLAVTYAQEGKRVLIVDTDLRKPSLHQLLSLSNLTGLTNVLMNETEWQQAVQETSVSGLFLLSCGPTPPNPSEILNSRKMQQLIDELKEQYDIILFDTPPALIISDSLIIASKCDGVILVVSGGVTKRQHAEKVCASLAHVNARMLGVVLNNKNKRERKKEYAVYFRK